MGNSMAHLSLRRKLLLIGLGILALSQSRIVRKFRQWRRGFVLIQQLPTPERAQPSKNYVLDDNFVNVGKNAENGKGHRVYRPFVERVRYNLVKALTSRIDSTPRAKEVGIMNVPILTEAMDKWFPFHTACFVVIFGNDKVKELLSAKAMPKLSKGFGYDVCDSLIGESVLKTSGEVWHEQRKTIEKGFTDEMMDKAMPRIVRTVGEMMTKWEKQFLGDAVVVHEEMLKLTMDVLGRSVLNYDFNSVTANTTDEAPLYNAFNVILSTLNMRALLLYHHFTRWLPTPTNQVSYHECLQSKDYIHKTAFFPLIQSSGAFLKGFCFTAL